LLNITIPYTPKQKTMFDNLFVHFSALETALLPYFLFLVYGVIVLWVKSELAGRTYIKPTEIAADNEVDSAIEIDGDYVISVPCPWVPDIAEVPSLETEFEMAVIERTILPVTQEELVKLPAIAAPVQKSRKSRKKGLSELIGLEVDRELGDVRSRVNN
jgi:hypothetical protein